MSQTLPPLNLLVSLPMRRLFASRSLFAKSLLVLVFCTGTLSTPAVAQSSGKASGTAYQKDIERAILGMTLDQPGTRSFHLRATFAPSFERDKSSHREGEIEIWWKSPTLWRQEVKTNGYHQIVIKDDGTTSQAASTPYTPEWLRELEQALLRPFPLGLKALEQNLRYSSGTGWSGSYSDFHDFHGRSIARTVASGSGVEVTAKIASLEELKNPPSQLFDINQLSGASPLASRS